MSNSHEKKLVVSFIQFSRQKIALGGCNEDQLEGLEVAIQCLEAAFGLTDGDYAFQPSRPLLEIFRTAEGLTNAEEEQAATQAEIDQSVKLKEDGNDLMKEQKYDEAIQKYNEAVKLHRDPVYFCNRAAAYCKLEQFDLAIQDCRTSLAIDPQYSKAYGRMGLALTCQKRYEQATKAYEQAITLDPDSENYKNNLKVAQNKLLEEQQGRTPQPAQSPFGGFDLASMLNNPAMMNMAAQLMNDPGVQNLMSTMVGGMSGQSGSEEQSAAPAMANLMQVGQQLAEQMQQNNPDLINQLRNQFPGGQNNPNNDGDSNNQNPPSGNT